MIIESSSEKTFKIARKRPEIQPFKVESQKLRNFCAHPVHGQAGNAQLNFEGGSISTVDLLVLTG